MTTKTDKKKLEDATALAGALAHVKDAEANLVAVTRQSNVDSDVDVVVYADHLRDAYATFNKALYPK